MSKKILISPAGERLRFDEEDIPELLGFGYRLETDEDIRLRKERKKFGEGVTPTLLAGSAGAARGLSFGASDQFLTKTGLVDPETLRKLQEFQPEASLIGEAAGIIAPIALTGGTGALAAIGRGAGAGVRGAASAGRLVQGAVIGKVAAPSLARKAVAGALGTATEGAFFSTGHLISEDALGGAELNAENVLWHAGVGAVLGGVAGAAFPVGKEAVSAAIAKIPRPSLESAGMKKVLGFVSPGKFAERAALQASVSRATRAKLRKRGLEEKAARYLLDNDIVTATSTPETIAARISADADVVAKQMDDVLGTLDAVKSQMPEKFVQVEDVLSRLRKEVAGPIARTETRAVRTSVSNEIKDIADKLGEKGPVTFRDLVGNRQALRNKAKFETFSKDPKALQTQKMYRILNQEIDKKADPLLRELGHTDAPLYRELRDKFSVLAELRKGSDKLAELHGTQNWIKFTDVLSFVPGLAVGVPGRDDTFLDNIVTALVLPAGVRLLQARLAPVSASVAKKVTNMSVLERAGKSRKELIDKTIRKFFTKEPSRLVAPATVLAFSRSGFGKGKDEADKAKSQISTITALSSNASDLTKKIGDRVSDIADIAPKTAASLVNKAQVAVQFLAQKAPRPPGLGVTVIEPDWDLPASELSKWKRYIAAVEKPATILENIADGVVSREELETLRVVYPEIHRELVKSLIEELSSRKKSLTTTQQTLLARVLGMPSSVMTTPSFVRNSQAVSVQVDEEQAPQQRVRRTQQATKINEKFETAVERIQQL